MGQRILGFMSMEKVINYFTNHKNLLYLISLFIGCTLIFLNLIFQVIVLAIVAAFAAYFCKTFENIVLKLFTTSYKFEGSVMWAKPLKYLK